MSNQKICAKINKKEQHDNTNYKEFRTIIWQEMNSFVSHTHL